MSKTIMVGGYGPGISSAVAERFGKEGFSVALVGRSAERVAKGVKALQAKGIRVEAFIDDLAQPEVARAVVGKVRARLGPITVLHWNAYANSACDLTTATTAEIRTVYEVAVTSLLAAVQEALPDLRQRKGAVLVTNGFVALFAPEVDAVAVSSGLMGLAVANAAKHKLVGLLAEKLRPDGIYVGEVVVTGGVKGTDFDTGNAKIEAATIGAKFWDLYQARKDTSVTI